MGEVWGSVGEKVWGSVAGAAAGSRSPGAEHCPSPEPYHIPYHTTTIPYHTSPLTISYHTIPEPCKPPYLTRTIMPPYLTPNRTMVPYHYTILYHIILYHIILYHTIPHKNHTIPHLFHTSAYMVPLVNIVLHFTHFPPLPPPAIPPSAVCVFLSQTGRQKMINQVWASRMSQAFLVLIMAGGPWTKNVTYWCCVVLVG